MRNWMHELASHYEQTRRRHSAEKLMIVFDIDGTIIDMRHMVLYVLQAYDRSQGTRFFRRLRVADIVVHENHVSDLLRQMDIPPRRREHILAWYLKHRWSSLAIHASHRPYQGVLEVIRWFQLQPNTFVGLNTGRPDALRLDTLHSLNKLAKEYRVRFRSDLLYMNPSDWGKSVENAKVAGVEYFRSAGYRVFAMIDNEPDNLRAIAKADPRQEILLLHAATILESRRKRLPRCSVQGDRYDITELISENTLPGHVQFVWHGVNDKLNLHRFLASNVHWGEVDVREDPVTQDMILRHDSFDESPLQDGEEPLRLADCLQQCGAHGRGVKLDLKLDAGLIDKVLDTAAACAFNDADLWFNANVERLHSQGFQTLANRFPGAIIQCPVDFLAPLIIASPEMAHKVLKMYCGWGINRFSVSWFTADKHQVLKRMESWGFEVNIYDVPDLESFLQAALLLPHSVTADFNFHKWGYYGHGSGAQSPRSYAVVRLSKTA